MQQVRDIMFTTDDEEKSNFVSLSSNIDNINGSVEVVNGILVLV